MNKLKSSVKRILSNSFFVSAFKVGSGQLVAQLLSVISVPILSRIYSDTAYGDTALISSTATILINAATLGLTSAIMKPEEDEEAKKIFTTAFIVTLTICIIFVGIFATLVNKYRLFNISGSYNLALLLMLFYCIFQSVNSLVQVYLNRKKEYNKLFFNPIIGAVSNIVIAVPLGLLGFGFEGFLITNIIASLVALCFMLKGCNPFCKNFHLRDIKAVFIENKDYILYQYPSNFIGNFGIEYPTQYFGRVFTTQELGGYSMCERILKLPIRLIAAPISTVYFRTASEYGREGRNLARFTYNMISKILLISFFPVVIFIFISEPLFVFVLGQNWAEAGFLASFLIIQYVLLFCSQTTSYCRVSLGKQRLNLILSIVRLLIAVLSCTIGYKYFHTMIATLFVFSIGQCIYNIFDMAINFFCMNKKYTFKYLISTVIYTILLYLIFIVKIRMF